MNKQQIINDPNSCLNRAADDEPVFVLRANDPLAANLIRLWVQAYVNDKAVTQEGEPTQTQIDKANDALSVAGQMDQWRQVQDHFNGRA